MKQLKKRALSLVLAVVMAIGLLSSPPMAVFAEEASQSMIIAVDKASGKPGETVKVPITVKNNPGLSSLKVDVEYDDQLLELTSVEFDPAFGATVTAPEPFKTPQTLSMISPLQEITADGTFATLSFKISDTAEDQAVSEVKISYDQDDIFNDSGDVTPTVENGSVTVYHGIPGDINGDKKVNNKDAILLFRYVAGWSESAIGQPIDLDAVDCNGDGKANNKDAILLFRYVAGWPGITITRGRVHQHTLEAVEFQAASCEKEGNIAYWHCTSCGKYYKDEKGSLEITLAQTVLPAAGHTFTDVWSYDQTYHWHAATCEHTSVVGDRAVHTFDSNGTCTVCGAVKTPDPEKEYTIEYRLMEYNENLGDSYISSQEIDNSKNPSSYEASKGVAHLEDPVCAGYSFLGWYTPDGERVTKIAAGTKQDMILFARWQEKTYSVNYRLYQTPIKPIADSYKTYTVSKGLVDMPNAEINNYVFLGWYTDDGTEVTEIPVGTTGNITLNGYWTSKRNQAKKVSKLSDPVIMDDVDNGVIYFAYELGTIENVPLSEIWRTSTVYGLGQQESKTVTTSTTQEKAEEIAQNITNATVDSATWSLAESWNEVTSVNEKWAEQNGMTVEEAETRARTDSNTYSVTSSESGGSTTTTTDGTTVRNYKEKDKTKETGSQFDVEVNGKYSHTNTSSAGLKFPIDIVDVSVGTESSSTFEIGGGVKYGNYDKNITNTHTGTDKTKVKTTVTEDTSSWNNSNTSSSTQTISQSSTVSKALSQVISTEKGYGKSYAYGGSGSESQGTSSSSSKSENTSSTLSYSTTETVTTTKTYSSDGKNEGNYRLVIAGTAHVFGVVGYDVASKSYCTYTYSVMDDETHEFLDYSPNTKFDDCEYGVLPFEIPYDVYEYVTAETAQTEGLQFKTNSQNKTAMLVDYVGSDTEVIVPTYISSLGTAYKVTEIDSDAFAGKNVQSVILSSQIKEIPDGAFKNCTELKEVSGNFTVIGAEAFSGCSSLDDFHVSAGVYSIGANAFRGVPKLTVEVLNEASAMEAAKKQKPDADETELKEAARVMTQNVVEAAAGGGAQNLVINLGSAIDGTTLKIDVPKMTSFELQGGKKAYTNVQLISEADTTVLKEMTINNTAGTPLKLSSGNVILEAVSITAPSFCMILTADAVNLTAIRDSSLTSGNGNAVVCKEPVFTSKVVDSAVGSLRISGNVYVCGQSAADQLKKARYLTVTDGEIKVISEEEFQNYCKGAYLVHFDAGEGTVSRESQTVYYGQVYGELPEAARDYYSFDGWYTEKDGGEQVTEATLFNGTSDVTLYAHWTEHELSGWVLESEAPVDSKVENTKWSYTLTEYTESGSDSMAGWTKYDTRRTGWGGTQGPVYSDPNNGVRNVWAENYVASTTTHYVYYHRTNGSLWGTDATASSWARHQIDLTYPLTAGYYDSTYKIQFYKTYTCPSCGNNHMWVPDGTYNVDNYATRWYFQDPVYTYYFTRNVQKEAAEDPTGQSNVSQVQKWVQYREK